MFWDKDDWDLDYDELVYGPEEEDEEEGAFFDVPYELQIRLRRKDHESKRTNQ